MAWITQADLPFLLGFAGAVVIVTASATLLLGRKLARRSRRLAIVASAAVCPVLFGALALVAFLGQRGPASNGAGAFVVSGLFQLTLLSIPVAALTAAGLIMRRPRAR